MNVEPHGPDRLVISEDQSRLDLDRCFAWLASSYWATGRSRDVMERSFAGSRVFGAYDVDGRQVGLARAVTDGATFCWIADVFVDDGERGRGIGTWMVGHLVEILKRDGVNRFLLGTRNAHSVYTKVGYAAPRVPEIYMDLDERPTRPTAADVDPAMRTPC